MPVPATRPLSAPAALAPGLAVAARAAGERGPGPHGGPQPRPRASGGPQGGAAEVAATGTGAGRALPRPARSPPRPGGRGQVQFVAAGAGAGACAQAALQAQQHLRPGRAGPRRHPPGRGGLAQRFRRDAACPGLARGRLSKGCVAGPLAQARRRRQERRPADRTAAPVGGAQPGAGGAHRRPPRCRSGRARLRGRGPRRADRRRRRQLRPAPAVASVVAAVSSLGRPARGGGRLRPLRGSRRCRSSVRPVARRCRAPLTPASPADRGRGPVDAMAAPPTRRVHAGDGPPRMIARSETVFARFAETPARRAQRAGAGGAAGRHRPAGPRHPGLSPEPGNGPAKAGPRHPSGSLVSAGRGCGRAGGRNGAGAHGRPGQRVGGKRGGRAPFRIATAAVRPDCPAAQAPVAAGMP